MTRSEYISLLLDMTIGNPMFTIPFGFVVAVSVSLYLFRILHEKSPSFVCGFIGTVSALLLNRGFQLVSSANIGTIMKPLPDWERMWLHEEDCFCFVWSYLIFVVLPFLFASLACILIRRHPSLGVSLLSGMRFSDRVFCWVAIALATLSIILFLGDFRPESFCFVQAAPFAFAIVASSRIWRKTEDDHERVLARRIFIVMACYVMFMGWIGWCAWSR